MSVINCSRNSIEYFEKNKQNNLIADSIVAKKLGLYFTKDLCDEIIKSDCNELTKQIVLADKNQIFIQAAKTYNKFDLTNLIEKTQTTPTLILIDENDKMYSEFVEWIKELNNSGIDVSSKGWDSEMIEYPFVFNHKGFYYMLYNGNNYGKSGFGLAILEN